MIGKHSTIVIPTEFISPESNSTGEYFFQIVEQLLIDGHSIKLIIPRSTENQQALALLRKSYGYSVDATFISEANDRKGASLLKALNSIMLTVRLWWNTKKVSSQGDVIFFGTNPTFLILFLSFFLSKKKNTKVLLAYDIFPDNLIAVSSSKIYQLIGKLVRPLFKNAYKRVDKTLVIGRCMKKRLVDWGVPEEQVFVVSNWADEAEVMPLDLKSDAEDNIDFQFLGNIGPLQGLELLLEAIPHVKSQQARFSFYGRGAYAEELRSFVHDNSHKYDIRFGGEVPRHERTKVLNQCDVAIVSLDKRVVGLGVPSKTYFSLAAGRPLLVIANKDSEPARLTTEYGVGWVSAHDDPLKLAALIDAICESKENHPTTSFIRALFLKKFSKSVGARAIIKQIEGASHRA